MVRSLRRVALTFAVLVLVGGIGVAIPKLASNGVAELPAAQQALGEEGLRSAAICVENPIQRLYTFRLRVDLIVPDPTCVEPTQPDYRLNGYRTVVSQRTFFGTAFGTITVCAPTTTCG